MAAVRRMPPAGCKLCTPAAVTVKAAIGYIDDEIQLANNNKSWYIHVILAHKNVTELSRCIRANTWFL